MTSFRLFSASHITKCIAKSVPSLTSQLCNDSLHAVCLSRQNGDHPGTVNVRQAEESQYKQTTELLAIAHTRTISLFVVSIVWW